WAIALLSAQPLRLCVDSMTVGTVSTAAGRRRRTGCAPAVGRRRHRNLSRSTYPEGVPVASVMPAAEQQARRPGCHDPRGFAMRSSNNVYESALVHTPTRPELLNVWSCASIRFVPSQYTCT